jgi:hypothetical protein
MAHRALYGVAVLVGWSVFAVAALGLLTVLGAEMGKPYHRLTDAFFVVGGDHEAGTAALAYGALLISSVTALASIFFGWRQDRRQARDLELKLKELQIKMLELQLKSAQASRPREQHAKASN